ncbi:MAG: hypothetical protein ACI4G0_03680 [Ruminococcus sp.]
MAEKEYIEREAALNVIKDEIENYQPYPDRYSITPYEFVRRGLNIAYSIIKNQSTADVQEVVRCKDCKWLNKVKMICMNPNNRVFNTGKTVYSNNFCNYGDKEN